MGISALLSIGVLIALFFIFRKRFGIKLVPVLVGAAAFVLFVMVLEAYVHNLILKPDAEGNIALRSQPILFMLYGGFMAGLFEETARFLCFHIMKRKYRGIGTALGYGIGHGGIEAILLAGVTMIANLILCVQINAGTPPAGIPEASVLALMAVPPSQFLIGGIERVLVLGIQIPLSVLVYYSVMAKGKWWLFPLAILLHAVVDFLPALYQTGVVTNLYAVEGVVALYSIGMIYLAVRTHRAYRGLEA
ncbi:YhfC family intramembrane metalloprotease [Eubacteriales bacterium OttesenSCG-928-N13]|nr:YhfC family intramembrane metalloprotease [Eubacteriales bacterium OttesenSCG-928-N13]